jgi:hypothetical protein
MTTLAEIEQAILGLPPQDKLKLVDWLDDHSEELMPLTEGQTAELLRRKKELVERPELAQPLGAEFFDGLRRKVAALRGA